MGSLADQDIFSSIRESFRNFSRGLSLRKQTLLLISEPNMSGALSLAPIEAALLDAGIPYRRRFTDQNPDSEPFIQVVENLEKPRSPMDGIVISASIVEGLRGSSGDSRKGPLCTVVQAHYMASEINPSSERLRRMRPWILSGNWISDSLDNTYDPVYSFLRDYLSEQGAIRVVPVTEVKSPEFRNFPWLDDSVLENASNEWQSSDLENRERIMGNLVTPIFALNSPSTTRAEELLWHCVLGPSWDSDLSSQIFRAHSIWERKTPVEAASTIADALVSKGEI